MTLKIGTNQTLSGLESSLVHGVSRDLWEAGGGGTFFSCWIKLECSLTLGLGISIHTLILVSLWNAHSTTCILSNLKSKKSFAGAVKGFQLFSIADRAYAVCDAFWANPDKLVKLNSRTVFFFPSCKIHCLYFWHSRDMILNSLM